ncbi:MAG: cob(I)yrinic acid a,c-diamide adenosyltransferase [Dehalococcoidales bacterium]|nr:cob(I)yrinic acid a,c-diamide adenosyltransferase [Dehalococcoidales bacterium]
MTDRKENPIGKGYVQIYTGNGKGKTTAALGLAFRAMGCGLKTYIGQFMKGQHCSELEAAKTTAGYITIEQYGKDAFIRMGKTPAIEDVRMAQAGLAKARKAILSGKHDIIVLDEIMTARYFRLVTTEEILKIIAAKPDGVELVLTGRYAPKKLIAAADLVTEMAEVKHYFQKGITSRNGIES